MTDSKNIDQIVQEFLADMSLTEKAAIANLDQDEVPCGYDLGKMVIGL